MQRYTSYIYERSAFLILFKFKIFYFNNFEFFTNQNVKLPMDI